MQYFVLYGRLFGVYVSGEIRARQCAVGHFCFGGTFYGIAQRYDFVIIFQLFFITVYGCIALRDVEVGVENESFPLRFYGAYAGFYFPPVVSCRVEGADVP